MPWLSDRLKSIGFRFSTPVQTSMMRGLMRPEVVTGSEFDGTEITTEILEKTETDVALRAVTGSGKTIAYLTSALTSISSDLFNREKFIYDAVIDEYGGSMNVLSEDNAEGDEEQEQKARENLAMKMAYSLSPSLQMAELGTVIQAWQEQPRSCARKPLLLVVCPSRELAAQVALKVFELFGGNIRQDYTPGDDERSIFNYRGPRGTRVVGLLDASELITREAQLKAVDVIVSTPEVVSSMYQQDVEYFDDLRVLVIDEADLSLQSEELANYPAISMLLTDRDTSKRRNILVGASFGAEAAEASLERGFLDKRNTVLVTANNYMHLTNLLQSQSAEEIFTSTMVAEGINHQILPVEAGESMRAMFGLLRHHLFTWENTAEDERGVRPRGLIYVKNDTVAQQIGESLRNAVWGKHKVYTLLPQRGQMPLQVLEQFAGAVTASLEAASKQKQSTTDSSVASSKSSNDFDVWRADTAPTLLLTTPSAARGLDFANLTHIYSLNVDPSEAEYAHQAGRLGRLGNLNIDGINAGIMTSIINPQEEAALRMRIVAVAGPDAKITVVPESLWQLTAPPTYADVTAAEGEGGDTRSAEEANARDDAIISRLEDLMKSYEQKTET
uniref:ATP-dependent RNA helicase n=1 Tax=Octactis speculum TaxID=3111310 RepID=A0A7S2BL63_9STRA